MDKQVIIIFMSALLLSRHSVQAQGMKKYYDSNWVETPKEKAFYYSDVIKEGDNYRFTSYWVQSGKFYGKSLWADTLFKKGIGSRTIYYESGKLHDSIAYNEKGSMKGSYIFYETGVPQETDTYNEEGNPKTVDLYSENGKQSTHAYYDKAKEEMVGQSFDDAGNAKPGYFTFLKTASFPGDVSAWSEYLQTHLKANIPTRRKAPAGTYQVVVSFIVGKDGKITEVKAENDPGYGTAEEAVRVIKNRPDWIPAVQNNKKVLYRQRQPITFQVTDK